ncbi:maleylpyruvate isomerase family mycothiol-dependent enzyme [Streptomyces yokosukanensis]|uniref:maleylpyruvate isomerase family mycothiol-dependent enzyme n=1 Tax=Streptomyces yokosukanensis TaxID=67386 RepID=UPI003412C561
MGKTARTAPDRAAIAAAIAAERYELADFFESLTPEQWDAPSLCAGWRVREVVAHLSMGFRYPTVKVLRELVKARGSLHRTTDRLARRDAAAHSDAELAGFLRTHAHHPWTPPIGGLVSALGHDVVHGLDVSVALGVDREVPEDRLRILLDAVDPRAFRIFGTDLAGVRLCAKDLDWSFGSGTPLYGRGQDLLLVAYGRGLPAGRLRGDAVNRFVTD